MSNKSTWRLGFVAAYYAPPADITDPIEKVKWHMTQTQKLGGGATQFSAPVEWTDANLNDLKEHMAKTDNELELGCQIFGGRGMPGSLTGDNKEEIRKGVDAQIKAAKFLGVKILRGAHGRLNVATSRFNKEKPFSEMKKFVVGNLKEIAKIMEDNDLYYAIENHCDFTGKEFAEIFTEVGSKRVGCTLDTANGFTVFCDPNEDVEYLAPYAVTTHVKDMLVQDFRHDTVKIIPMIPRGCTLGEGHVDIPRALDLLDQKCPNAKGLHIIIENGWVNYENVADKDSFDKKSIHDGLDYLKKCIGR